MLWVRNETIHVNQCRAFVDYNLAGMAITHMQLPPETCHQHGAFVGLPPPLPALNIHPLAIPKALQHEPKHGKAGQKENNQNRFLARSAVAVAAVTS